MTTGQGRFVLGRGGRAIGGSGGAGILFALVGGGTGTVGAVATAAAAKRLFLTTLTVYLSSLATSLYAAYSIHINIY